MYKIEINSEHKDQDFSNTAVNEKSPVVEIFKSMIEGKELSKFNKNLANKSVEFLKSLGERAKNGDFTAVCELNNIRRIAIEPTLLQELKLLGFFGTYQALGFGESIEMETYSHQGEKSRFQALYGDVVFPAIVKEKYPVPTQVISGGFAADYRAISLGDMTRENEGMEQVRIDIRNKAAKYVIETVYNKIQNATGVKYTAEGAGITKTALDNVIKNVRRFGKPSLIGDYSVVPQVNDYVPYSSISMGFKGLSDAAMEEIRKTGLLGVYNGSEVIEIPNAFDLTTIVDSSAGKNFVPLFPQGLLFIIPQGLNSPIRTWTRGGITSFSGNDVTTGKVLSRFDLEIAADVARGQEYKIGIIKDTNLD